MLLTLMVRHQEAESFESFRFEPDRPFTFEPADQIALFRQWVDEGSAP